ncbi:AAA family ATPase [Telmatospirillum sp. J64-1]|uniref:AAA family ATPase n=1 Tax=Telmatospirillum sp. J64-1 TaxID=2502183 RepID=UPI00115D2CFA|nr:ATP-binding protein [Telmatospirillum sp. J64-1]
MTHIAAPVNTIAPLRNVAIAMAAMKCAVERPRHLPGMVTFSGPSGFGKSMAAAYVANKFRAYYVEAKSSWTKKTLLQAILREMGKVPAKNASDMTDQICEELILSGRPLIIDEMDHIVEKKAVEGVRDIYLGCNAPILLIGEELLPIKLRQWERFHGRILDCFQAEPMDIGDARHLRGLYCQQIEVADDLLELILAASHGSARRVCINLERVRTEALSDGIALADRAWWGDRALHTGEPPKRRVF